MAGIAEIAGDGRILNSEVGGQAVTGSGCADFGGERLRFKQLTDWLGPEFNGVIAFDEARLMKNTAATKCCAREHCSHSSGTLPRFANLTVPPRRAAIRKTLHHGAWRHPYAVARAEAGLLPVITLFFKQVPACLAASAFSMMVLIVGGTTGSVS